VSQNDRNPGFFELAGETIFEAFAQQIPFVNRQHRYIGQRATAVLG
jgi:hypothetical protein